MTGLAQTILKNHNRLFLGLVCIVALLAACFQVLGSSEEPRGSVPISQVIADAQNGKLARIETQYPDSHELVVTYKGSPRRVVSSRVASNESILSLLEDAHVPLDSLTVVAAPPSPLPFSVGDTLLVVVPIVVLTLLFQISHLRKVRQQATQQAPDRPVKE